MARQPGVARAQAPATRVAGSLSFVRALEGVLSVSVLILLILFTNIGGASIERHDAIVDHLRQLKQLDATLNQHLLKLRYGLLPDYETLLQTLVDLRALRHDLTTGRVAIYRQGRPAIDRAFEAYSELLVDKAAMIEQFSAKCRVFDQAIRTFPALAAEVAAQSTGRNTADPLSATLTELVQTVLLYNLTIEPALQSEFQRRIADLGRLRGAYPPEVAGNLRAVIVQAQAILQQKQEIDAGVAQFVTMPTVQRLDELYQAYTAHYLQTMQRANRYRLYLVGLCALLLICMAYTMLKLKATVRLLDRRQQELTDVNARLETEIAERKRLEQRQRGQGEALARTNQELGQQQQRMAELLEDLQAVNQRLRELSALKDEFVSTASHELRTPLTAIKEGISLMLDGALGAINDEQLEFMRDVDQSIDRLTDLINNLLDLSKIEAGRMRLARGRVEFRGLIEETVKRYQAVGGHRRISAQVDTIPPVFVDPDRIRQVLGNLLSNAVKFTEEHGTITLTARTSGGQVLVAVQDNGVGIAKADVPDLFRKFSQVGKAQGRQGTGLGLALCKELVTAHRGSLWVTSEPQHGSQFFFTVPVYTTRFALEESFLDQLAYARGDGRLVGLVTVQVAQGRDAASAASPASPEALEEVERVVRSHVHRTDAVLSNEPHGVVVLAATEPDGLLAIVRRLQTVLPALAPSRRDTPGAAWRLKFGVAVYPSDGADVHTLVAKATQSPTDDLAAVEAAVWESHARAKTRGRVEDGDMESRAEEASHG